MIYYGSLVYAHGYIDDNTGEMVFSFAHIEMRESRICVGYDPHVNCYRAERSTLPYDYRPTSWVSKKGRYSFSQAISYSYRNYPGPDKVDETYFDKIKYAGGFTGMDAHYNFRIIV